NTAPLASRAALAIAATRPAYTLATNSARALSAATARANAIPVSTSAANAEITNMLSFAEIIYSPRAHRGVARCRRRQSGKFQPHERRYRRRETRQASPPPPGL